MIVWRLFEVKQHKCKLVLGWVTIWWVVLLIRRLKFPAWNPTGMLRSRSTKSLTLEDSLKLLCKQWLRRLTSGHNYVFLRLLLIILFRQTFFRNEFCFDQRLFWLKNFQTQIFVDPRWSSLVFWYKPRVPTWLRQLFLFEETKIHTKFLPFFVKKYTKFPPPPCLKVD